MDSPPIYFFGDDQMYGLEVYARLEKSCQTVNLAADGNTILQTLEIIKARKGVLFELGAVAVVCVGTIDALRLQDNTASTSFRKALNHLRAIWDRLLNDFLRVVWVPVPYLPMYSISQHKFVKGLNEYMETKCNQNHIVYNVTFINDHRIVTPDPKTFLEKDQIHFNRAAFKIILNEIL